MKPALLKTFRFDRVPDSIYIELVDSLFSLIPPIIIFAITHFIIGLAIAAETSDTWILALAIAGVLVSIERIAMARKYRRDTAAVPLSVTTARSWERRFALRSVTTAVVVSAMGVRAFMLPDETSHMLITGALFAYAAGTITRVAYRPRLALLNLGIVAIPPAIACLLDGGVVHACLSLTMMIFLLGAVETTAHLYRTIVSHLTLKQRFAGLARLDPLTGLSNRLVLNEWLEPILAEANRKQIGLAVHSLDLNHFKAANDRFGHPAGDGILKEVAARLSLLTRSSDLLVRLGGDEFILIQTGVDTREQAISLATRIAQDIGAPYAISGYDIRIGTSIGIALLSREQLTAEELLVRADQALYQAKRTGTSFAVYTVAPQLVPLPQDHDAEPAESRKLVNLR
jgi:diguanylate cyclase (GGDEF)-like protein